MTKTTSSSLPSPLRPDDFTPQSRLAGYAKATIDCVNTPGVLPPEIEELVAPAAVGALRSVISVLKNVEPAPVKPDDLRNAGSQVEAIFEQLAALTEATAQKNDSEQMQMFMEIAPAALKVMEASAIELQKTRRELALQQEELENRELNLLAREEELAKEKQKLEEERAFFELERAEFVESNGAGFIQESVLPSNKSIPLDTLRPASAKTIYAELQVISGSGGAHLTTKK